PVTPGGGSIQLEMCPRRGNRLIRTGLPGGYRHITHSPALTPYLAGGVGVLGQSRAQVVHGEVDDLGKALAVHRGHQVEHRRLFHEACQHPAVQCWQYRIADIVRMQRQVEYHLLAESQYLHAEHPRIGNLFDQRHVVAGIMRITDQLLDTFVHAAPPAANCILSRSSEPLPMRMKVPTTWASGSSRDCW